MNHASPAASFSVPQSQNTAPVLEFRCLYTHDLRRKQKRWQDGRLKFHTFNKRIMVYDERNHFVGDCHWKGDDFVEGEELELERGNVLVEVGECIARTDQDLTELLDKRVHEREERGAARIANGSLAHLQTSPVRAQPSTIVSGQLKPKSLNAVIGTPSGHYGRAVISNISPYEKNHGKHDENVVERPAKRRKQNEVPSKSGYAHSLLGSTLDLTSSRSSSMASIRYEPLKVSINRANTIDLTGHDSDPQAQPARRSPSRIAKRKARKSPPAKSGYASSLLGASLDLNTSSSSVFRSFESTSRHVRPRQNNAIRASSEVDDGTAAGATIDQVPSVPARQLADARNQKKKPSGEVPPVRSKSPVNSDPARRKADLPRRRANSHRSETFEQPACSPTQELSHKTLVPKTALSSKTVPRVLSDQPVATLRIKSRPPRKMMMLMDPPPRPLSSRSINSQSPTPSYSHDKSAFTEVVKLPLARNEVTLQERELPSLGSKQASSPVIDSGIDHRTIDSLLTRRRESNMESPAAPSELPHSLPVDQEFVRLEMVGQGQDVLSSPAAPQPAFKKTSQFERTSNKSTSPSATSPQRVLLAATRTENSRQQPKEAQKPTDHTPSWQREATKPTDTTLQTVIKPANYAAISDKAPGLQEVRSLHIAHANSAAGTFVAAEREISNEEVQIPKQAQPFAPEFLSPNEATLGDILDIAEKHADTEAPRPNYKLPFTAVLGEPATPRQKLPEIVAAQQLVSTLPLPEIHSVVPAQRKQSNPATRGPSITAMANKTADRLASSGQDMPAPSVVNRPRITNARRSADSRTVAGALGEVESSGPWSRESFDLFGTWRPPGRALGMSGTAG